MTDTPSTDPADDDLLASLYLDGEATAAERAQVEADPELMARVRSFEVMASDLSSVTPPPDLARLQIGAALDAFDQQNESSTPPLRAVPSPQAASTGAISSETASSKTASSSTVTSLSDQRERKQARGIPNWLAAAAALALVVGGLGFVSTLVGGGDDTDTASVALDSDDASASGANRTFDEESSAEAESAETLMTESDAMDTEAMEDDAMADDATDEAAEAPEEAMEEAEAEVETSGDDAATDEASDDDTSSEDTSSDETAVAAGPVPLDGLEAATAQEYFELLSGQPLRPVADSPCAESPLVTGLFGVDSFIEVVFDGEVSSLLVQDGVPSTAVIVGPTCQVELE